MKNFLAAPKMMSFSHLPPVKKTAFLMELENFLALLISWRRYSNSQYSITSFDCSWFWAKNLSNFVSLPWKLHNRYCHIMNLHWWVSSSLLRLEFRSVTNHEGVFCILGQGMGSFFPIDYSIIRMHKFLLKRSICFCFMYFRYTNHFDMSFYPDLILTLSWFYPDFI